MVANSLEMDVDKLSDGFTIAEMIGWWTLARFEVPLPSFPTYRKTKPNEATEVNLLIVNKIDKYRQKRSHGSYPTLFHMVTDILASLFEKLLPNAPRPYRRFGLGPERENEAKRSHASYGLCYQYVRPKSEKTKPWQVSHLAAITYKDFRPHFREVATDGAGPAYQH
jgi:hypothetical protein